MSAGWGFLIRLELSALRHRPIFGFVLSNLNACAAELIGAVHFEWEQASEEDRKSREPLELLIGERDRMINSCVLLLHNRSVFREDPAIEFGRQ